jgi:allantoate deiminase
MRHRRDALAAAAEWLLFIEQTTQAFAPDIVATVGTLQCEPGAVNVIPGAVSLTLDIRSPQDEARDALLQRLLDQVGVIAARRGVGFSHEIFYTIAATPCDEALRARLSDAVREVQGRTLLLPSGAGHDAIAIAERWPSAMLFVRCAGGISHHPAESVAEDDVAQALRAFSLAVGQLIARPSAIA